MKQLSSVSPTISLYPCCSELVNFIHKGLGQLNQAYNLLIHISFNHNHLPFTSSISYCIFN